VPETLLVPEAITGSEQVSHFRDPLHVVAELARAPTKPRQLLGCFLQVQAHASARAAPLCRLGWQQVHSPGAHWRAA